MALQLLTTVPADMDAISGLMLDSFKAGPDAFFVDRQLLHWKYFESGPMWKGSRGYVLKKDEVIQAHCGVWPLDLQFAGGQVTCLCFMDWVGGRSLPGAGFLLKKKLLTYAETAIVVGGTDDTRAVIPRLGFEPVGEVKFFARIVRPWKQFRTRPSEGLARDAARLIRNAGWSRAMVNATIPKEWTVVAVKSFEEVAIDGSQRQYPTPQRSVEYLNYWLRCPAAILSGFALQKESMTYGYFLLSRVGGQSRIADMRLSSSKQDEWNAAYALAALTAAADPNTCEIAAVASTDFSEIALRSSGFRQRGSAPLFVYDPKRKLKQSPPIFWNQIDGDAAYMQDPEHPYTT